MSPMVVEHSGLRLSWALRLPTIAYISRISLITAGSSGQ